jgi:beta-glucuronidase
MRRLYEVIAFGALVVGAASLALTAWLWLGDWPQRTKELVDYQRSAAQNAGRPPDPLVAGAAARAGASLAGTWPAVIDPYGRGALAGIAPRDVRPQSPSDLAEFSFDDGLTLEVPGDWNSQDPRLVFYTGTVWYKRRFEHRPAPGARTFLWFGAAHYRATVYLNGRLLGEHEGGFSPFNFEVSGLLRHGENLLVVRVDNHKLDDDVPTPMTDWLNYGGLTRDVRLVQVPRVFVRTWRIGLDPENPGRIAAEVVLDGSGGPEDVSLAIPDLGLEATAQSDASGVARFSFEAAPERWSPGSPRLYRVEMRAGEDAVSDEIGFRSVAVRGREILLNGEPVFLRGISIHDEAGHGEGRVHSLVQAQRILGWARELGCNFVRLSHYPHSEETVQLAERMGLMVWSEIPVYWNVAFESERTLALARQQLSEMIERDRNRAAVIIWSIGNETPETEARLRFMTALAEHTRAEDPSRLVSAALLTGQEALVPFMTRYYLPALAGIVREVWPFRIRDPLVDVVDVAAVNEYFGWYYSGAVGFLGPVSSERARRVMLDNMHRIRIQLDAEKPLVVSELGAGARAGLHAPEQELAVFSEEYQALVYRRQLEMLERQQGLAGISPWVLKDFRSPLRMHQSVQGYWNLKGLVADDGTRKPAFALLRDWYRALAHAEGGA